MSGLSKKRGREEAEEVAVAGAASEAKRCREAEQILHLFEDIDSEDRNEEEQDGAPSEELLCGVMRSLEEEIGVSCSTSYEGSDSSALSRDGSVVSNMTSAAAGSAAAGGVDIDYLLGASDDELGILPSSVVDLSEEGFRTPLHDCGGGPKPVEFENTEVRRFGDNWHFDDDLVDFQQFTYIDDAAAGGFDLVNHESFMEAVWRLEAAGGMY